MKCWKATSAWRCRLGSVVTGYALDVGDQMIAGVLLDRPQAEAVYEARVRAGVDPGLAQVDEDEVFTTRVFPIPARGGRTVRLTFATPLPPTGYRLPLAFAAPTGGWSMSRCR